MQPAIHVHKLTKIYHTYQKEAGFRGALRGLVRRRYKETAAAKEVSSPSTKASSSASSARTARAKRPS